MKVTALPGQVSGGRGPLPGLVSMEPSGTVALTSTVPGRQSQVHQVSGLGSRAWGGDRGKGGRHEMQCALEKEDKPQQG